MERDQGGLQREAHEEKSGGQVDGDREASTGAKGLGDLGEVEVAGDVVDDGDGHQDEGAGDGAQDEVLEGGFEFVGLGAEGDEGVTGDAGDLEEDEEVKEVAREDDAVHPREHQQK